MIRYAMGVFAFLLALDAFDDKHRQNFGSYEWAEVALIGLLVLAILLITLTDKDQ